MAGSTAWHLHHASHWIPGWSGGTMLVHSSSGDHATYRTASVSAAFDEDFERLGANYDTYVAQTSRDRFEPALAFVNQVKTPRVLITTPAMHTQLWSMTCARGLAPPPGLAFVLVADAIALYGHAHGVTRAAATASLQPRHQAHLASEARKYNRAVRRGETPPSRSPITISAIAIYLSKVEVARKAGELIQMHVNPGVVRSSWHDGSMFAARPSARNPGGMVQPPSDLSISRMDSLLDQAGPSSEIYALVFHEWTWTSFFAGTLAGLAWLSAEVRTQMVKHPTEWRDTILIREALDALQNRVQAIIVDPAENVTPLYVPVILLSAGTFPGKRGTMSWPDVLRYGLIAPIS